MHRWCIFAPMSCFPRGSCFDSGARPRQFNMVSLLCRLERGAGSHSSVVPRVVPYSLLARSASGPRRVYSRARGESHCRPHRSHGEVLLGWPRTGEGQSPLLRRGFSSIRISAPTMRWMGSEAWRVSTPRPVGSHDTSISLLVEAHGWYYNGTFYFVSLYSLV